MQRGDGANEAGGASLWGGGRGDLFDTAFLRLRFEKLGISQTFNLQFFSNNVLYFCNFFIVTILDVTIFKKSRKKVINPNYSLGFVYHHDLSIAHASLGVSYKWINQRLLSDQCM